MIGVGADGNKKLVPVRFLDPMSWAEIVELHKADTAEDQVSEATLRRAYALRWKGCLKIRKKGQHARCAKCASHTAARKEAVTHEDKVAVAMSRKHHIDDVKADRSCETRGGSTS